MLIKQHGFLLFWVALMDSALPFLFQSWRGLYHFPPVLLPGHRLQEIPVSLPDDTSLTSHSGE